MATDVEIQKFVQRHHGFIPKTGWIAHVKEVLGAVIGYHIEATDGDVSVTWTISSWRTRPGRSGT
jgi:hypothetical protein